MTKRTAISAFLVFGSLLWLAPTPAAAVPKMDVKFYAGVGGLTLVPRVPVITLTSGTEVGGRSASSFFAWNIGVSARVRAGKIFGEIGLEWSRFFFEIDETLEEIAIDEGNPLPPGIAGSRAQMNSFVIPMLAGWVPYKNHIFKLYLYGGLMNQFNIRGFVEAQAGDVKFKPKDIPGFPLAIYVASARLGVAWDIASFNFDFYYAISMNSYTVTDFRTNAHTYRFQLGWLF